MSTFNSNTPLLNYNPKPVAGMATIHARVAHLSQRRTKVMATAHTEDVCSGILVMVTPFLQNR